MIKEKLEGNPLVNKLNRKLVLIEIEKKVIEVSCGFMDDDMYSTEDAVDVLMQVIDLQEMERQGVMSEIG